LSYTNRQLLLTPNQAIDEPFKDDMSGLTLVAEGPGYHEFEICYVMSDSPASQAGLRKGDWLTSLDGHPATDLRLDRIRDALKQEGAKRTIGIRRKEQTFQVEITLQRLV
jgi:C-terminal processing protease CtpA/Prc